MERFKQRFYDSHRWLPLDPDPDQIAQTQSIHSDPAHIAVVAFGAFFGTLARYEIGVWLPTGKDDWPTATLLINISGAFLLGLLLQALLEHGKDKGSRRIMRLAIGTGFMGAFTTYSSLAVSVSTLVSDGKISMAVLYAVISLVFGVIAAALGIQTPALIKKWRMK